MCLESQSGDSRNPSNLLLIIVMENALEPDQRYGYPNTMFVRFLKLCFLISAFVCGLLLVEDGSGVNASEPKELVKSGVWSAYTYKEGG